MNRIGELAVSLATAGALLAGIGLAAAQGASQTVVITRIDPAGLVQAHRATKVIGASVVNEQNEKVGSVDDLLIQTDGNNRVVFAVISVGGFLGVGGKNIAVPYSNLGAQDETHMVLRGATKEQIQALPEFKYAD